MSCGPLNSETDITKSARPNIISIQFSSVQFSLIQFNSIQFNSGACNQCETISSAYLALLATEIAATSSFLLLGIKG